MRNVRTDRLAELIALVSLGVLVVGSALAVGTVHYATLLWVSAFAIASGGVVLLLARARVRRLQAPAILLFGLAAWSALQAVPLPMSVLSHLAPHNADIWARALLPWGEPPLRFAPISLDPGASLVEALKWFVYGTVFTLACLVVSWRSRTALTTVAFGSAVTVAVVALGHGLAGATSLFGIYTPELAIPRWGVPPILNPNNLSGYLNLGAFCGLGLLLARRKQDEPPPIVRRGLITTGLAVVVAVSVLAASRAGVLGLALGVMLFAGLVRISGSDERERAEIRGEKPQTGKSVLPGVVAIAGGLLLAVVGASSATWSELWDANAEKLRVATWSLPLIRDFPIFGIGRGAFSTVFPAYRPASGNTLYVYPENFVIQWIAEWGLPVAAAALAALVWSYRPGRAVSRTDSIRIGAWVGMGVLLLQNLVDLALEVPAIAILACVVLGSLYVQRARLEDRPSGDEEAWPPEKRRRKQRTVARLRRRALAFAVMLLGSLAFTLAALYGRDQVEDERFEMQSAYQALHVEDPASLATFRDRLRHTILRHPADPYFPLLGALAEYRVKGGNPMPWIAASLERDPMNARAHIVLSDILATKGAKKQALMELRLAAESDANLRWAVGQNAVRLAHDVENLERVVPDGPKGAPVLCSLAAYVQGNENQAVRMTLLEHALARDPSSTEALSARAREVLTAVTTGVAPCERPERSACLDRVRQDAETIRGISPTSCQPLMLKAHALELEERAEEGEGVLAAGCGSCQEAEQCCADRVRLAAARKSSDTLPAAVRAYLAVGCSRETPCVHPQLFVGDLFAGRGDWPAASEHYRMAAMASDTPELWLKAADAASRAGNPILAGQQLSKAQRRGGGDPNLEKKVQEQRKELMRQELDVGARPK